MKSPTPVLILLSFCLASSLSAADKPNIIYIISDDLGYGDLSSYGQKEFQTPNIDRLANEGVKFTQHYSGSTVCAPSRSSLMTGQDTGHTFIRGNGEHQLRPKDLTVAELLKGAGYTTGMVGKSCVTGNTFDPEAPHIAGFDYFYGTLSHRTAHHHYPASVFEQGESVKLKGNKGKTGQTYDVDIYAEKALKFIEEHHEAPFFLLLSFPVPHADVRAPKGAAAPFIGQFEDEVSYKGGHYAASKHVKAHYAGMIARMDRRVGEVLSKLAELGIDENTVVSFTSDNGPHFEGGYNPSLFNSSGGLRGGKRDLYEGGIRVPLVVRWPAGIQAGRISEHPSAFWDFLPTACDLAGVTSPRGIQGVSYLAAMTGKRSQTSHPYLYWEFHEKGGRVALRQGDWKLIRYDVNKENPKPWELYDLSADPSESNDLAEKHPSKVRDLRRLISQAREKSPQAKWNFVKPL